MVGRVGSTGGVTTGGVTTATSVGLGGSGGGFEAQAETASMVTARAERLSFRIVISLLVPGAPPKKARYPIPRYYLRIAIELQDGGSILTLEGSIYFEAFCGKGEATLQSSNVAYAIFSVT